MKKLLFVISFLGYFAVTSGIVVNMHYCMKRLVSVHLFDTNDGLCGKCGMEIHEDTGCCREEVRLVKLTIDQDKTAVEAQGNYTIKTGSISPSVYLNVPFVPTTPQHYFTYHSPPETGKQDTYLRNNVFRI